MGPQSVDRVTMRAEAEVEAAEVEDPPPPNPAPADKAVEEVELVISPPGPTPPLPSLTPTPTVEYVVEVTPATVSVTGRGGVLDTSTPLHLEVPGVREEGLEGQVMLMTGEAMRLCPTSTVLLAVFVAGS